MNINEINFENRYGPKMDYNSFLQRFLSYCVTKKVKKGEHLLHAGEVNNHVYFVKKGLLRAYVIRSGREFNTWFKIENDFYFSPNSFYYGIPSDESIQALEDCEILIANKKVYHLIHKINHIATKYAIDYVEFALCECQEQCIALRCLSAEKQYEFLFKNRRNLLDRVSQKHIASYLGIEETYLSKIITKHKQTHNK